MQQQAQQAASPLAGGAAANAPQAPQQPIFGMPAILGAVQGGAYRIFYDDATQDPFNGSYGGALEEFRVPVQGNPVNTPAELATKVYEVADQGFPMAFLALTRSATAAVDDPGLVTCYHRLTKFKTRMGLPATPFDSVAFAFLGDLVQHQAPPSVVWEGTNFHVVNQLVLVPTVQMMDQFLAAVPAEPLLGPYQNADAGTEVIKTRRTVLLPQKYVSLFIDNSLTPRDAWVRLTAAIQANGDEVPCEVLVDWLRSSMVRASANQPWSYLAMAAPELPVIATPQDNVALTNYRWSFIHRDIPNLRSTPLTQGATQIALGLGQLASEQRLARTEADQRRQVEANKLPSDLFGSNVIKLMRWCQVSTENQLPQVWKDLAKAPKGRQRQVLERAVNEAVESLGYQNLNLQITLAVSKRIIGLEWVMFTDDDLGSGLHPFTVGYISPEQAEDQRKQNRMTDLIQSGEAAPTLTDAKEIMDNPEVHIPILVTQARFTHMRFLALLQALLTTNHPLVQSYKDFVDEFAALEPELDCARPRNPQDYFIAPALMVRWVQLRISYWIRRQATTNRAQSVPSFIELFDDIALERDWAPSFPEKYLKDPGLPAATIGQTSVGIDASSVVSGMTSVTGGASMAGGTNPQGSGSVRTNSVLTNPIDVKPRFKHFKQMNLRARDVKSRATEEPPMNTNKNCKMCPSFHFKGICNTNCGGAGDHGPHTDAQDDLLEAWGTKHWKPVSSA